MGGSEDALGRAKAAAAALTPGDTYSAAKLAKEWTDPTPIIIGDRVTYDGVPDVLLLQAGRTWVVQELESLSARYPSSREIASALAFARADSEMHFDEFHLSRSAFRGAVDRKLRRLTSLVEENPTDRRVLHLVASALSNVGASERTRSWAPDLAVQAVQLLYALADEVPQDGTIAGHTAFFIWEGSQKSSDSAERELLANRLRELAARHPDQGIADYVSRGSGGLQSTGGCYVATAVYGSYDCPEVRVLRRFRDRFLARSRSGRLAIAAYYAASPALVRRLGRQRWFGAWLRPPLNLLVARLQRAGFEQAPYSDPATERL